MPAATCFSCCFLRGLGRNLLISYHQGPDTLQKTNVSVFIANVDLHGACKAVARAGFAVGGPFMLQGQHGVGTGHGSRGGS